MAYDSLRQWLTKLEEEGQLKRIKAKVDWDEEIGGIAQAAYDMKNQAPALLFENIKDYQDGDFRRFFTGSLSTYGRIARELGVVGGGRAVGNALAANPFPLLIPCHRAVRSTGALGGYQGGLEMKKALLEMEGVVFSSPIKVSLNKVYY